MYVADFELWRQHRHHYQNPMTNWLLPPGWHQYDPEVLWPAGLMGSMRNYLGQYPEWYCKL